MSEPAITPRIFQHRRILRVGLAAYDQAVQLLGDAARHLGTVQAVVGIAKGGLAPARRIATVLGVTEYQVGARHNPTSDIHTQATGHVEVDITAIATTVHGHVIAEHVLLVDDICGTGATFAAVRAALQPYLHPDTRVSTLALCRNAGTSHEPDLWAWTVDDWVLFPWEPRPSSTMPVEDLPVPNAVNGP
jgi:uncharacterized protein